MLPFTAVSSVFPLSLALFAGLAQGYIWTLLGIDMRHNSQIDFVLWQTIIWLPLWSVKAVSSYSHLD